MNNRKQLTFIYPPRWEREYFGKDNFLVPYFLGKMLDCHVSIVYPLTETNKDFPNTFKGVTLIPVRIRKRKFLLRGGGREFYRYVIKNAKKIDYLMTFDHSIGSGMFAVLYKTINRKGKFYVKLDAGPGLVERKESSNFLKRQFYRLINKLYLKFVDVASVENSEVFEKIRLSNDKRFAYGNKLLLMPNGFDEELLATLNINENNFNQKENIFITVGRLGIYEKNTEMLLKALSLVDLQDWKFYLIGPINESINEAINEFYQNCPDKKDSVIFTGPIYNKKELWEYYNKAKVFVLTSRSEGFPIVFGEAKRFRNYILTTGIGGAKDTICNSKFGQIVRMDDADDLSNKMVSIISGQQNINVYTDFNSRELSYEHLLKEVVERLKY